MSRKSAAISDEVAQQAKLGAAHRVVFWALKNPGQRDVIARFELVEPAPTLHRQELMVSGGPN